MNDTQGVFPTFDNFNLNDDLNERPYEQLFNILKRRCYIYFFVGGEKKYMILFQNNVYAISEFHLFILIFTVSYYSTYALRLLFDKYSIGQKAKKKLKVLKAKCKNRIKKIRKKSNFWKQINRFRGGSSEIMYYETEEYGLANITKDQQGFPDLLRRYTPISPYLSKNNRYVKSIIKKCLKPNSYFKITDQKLIGIIQEMIPFSRREKVRVISYDLFVLAIVQTFSNVPIQSAKYEGLGKALRSLVNDWGVPIIAVAGGVAGAFGIPLNGGVFQFIAGGLGAGVTNYGAAETISRLTIQCPQYVTELPEAVVPPLLPNGDWACDPLPSINGTDLKVSLFVTNKPTKMDLFVSTSPDPRHYLHQQVVKDLNIETLDGYVKYYRQINGEHRLDWCRNITKNLPVDKVKSHFIPLDTRTRTIADVLKLDDTYTKGAARDIIDSIKKEDIIQRVIENSIE